MDRRTGFFLVAAALGAILTPLADEEHRWVAIAVTATYLVFVAASILEKWSRDRTQARREGRR